MTVSARNTPHDAQSTTHNGQDSYGDPVTESKHLAAAREAMERIKQREEANARDRELRDAEIAAAIFEDGLRPPQIASALGTGMSVSNVRAIERVARAAARGGPKREQ